MIKTIVAEDFELTESLRNHIEKHIEDIKTHLSNGSSVRVYLMKEADHMLKAEIKVHSYRREFLATVSGGDLYSCLFEAKKNIIRQVEDLKNKRKSVLRKRARQLKKQNLLAPLWSTQP